MKVFKLCLFWVVVTIFFIDLDPAPDSYLPLFLPIVILVMVGAVIWSISIVVWEHIK
jgi:hypothetical protein